MHDPSLSTIFLALLLAAGTQPMDARGAGLHRSGIAAATDSASGAELLQLNPEPTNAASIASLFHRSHPLHNVAIIIDTTASMNVVDKDSHCGTRLSCALSGVRILLTKFTPCKGKSSCITESSAKPTNAGDTVSLFTFPNVTAGTAERDFDCGQENPRIAPASLPAPGESTYILAALPAATPTYQIVGFSNDYRTSNKTTTLNPSSSLVKAVHGVSGCQGLKAVGGWATYYAGVIYAAQISLIAEQASRPNSQNVMILITDGDANASQWQMQRGATRSGNYPSFINECGQAIAAAKDASKAGTTIYAIGYGATSSGCPTDVSGFSKGYSSCQTMQAIATAPAFFFSISMDSLPTGRNGPQPTSCTSAAHPETNLDDIFAKIAASIRAAKASQKRR